MRTDCDAIRVRNLRTLKKERARLRSVCRQIEEEERERLVFLKRNFVKLALNSIFPHQRMQAGLWKMLTYAVKGAWTSPNFKSTLLRVAVTLVEFFGVREAVRLFQQYFKRNRRKKREAKEAEEKRKEEAATAPAVQASDAVEAVSVNPA